MNKINYHINIIRMLTFLTFLFIFDCVNNKCIQNIMYLRRSGNAAENIIFCHVTYKLRQLLFKTQKVFYGNNIYRVITAQADYVLRNDSSLAHLQAAAEQLCTKLLAEGGAGKEL